MLLCHPGDSVIEILECEAFVKEFLRLLDGSLSLFLRGALLQELIEAIYEEWERECM